MNTMLLIIAYVIDTIFTVPLTLYKSYQNRKRLGSYHYNVALHYDYKWCSQIFYGYDGHTVSAVCYNKLINGNARYAKYVYMIDLIFREDTHCKTAYEKEFKTKE